jgi:hypothetical protein
VIFAIFDLAQYLLKVGRYSCKSLEASGLRVAEPSLLGSAELDKLDVGDIIFYHSSYSLLAWGIMYYSNGPISHCATSVGDGPVLDATDGRGFIQALRAPREISIAQRDKIKQFAQQEVGKGFNWSGVFRLWGLIILGSHPAYRVKFSIDLMILLVAIAGLVRVFPWLPTAVVVAAAALYISIVWRNRLAGRHAGGSRESECASTVRDAVEITPDMIPAPPESNFEVIELGDGNLDRFADQIRNLAANPGRLLVELTAAPLSGYRLRAATRAGVVCAVLGSRDTWNIAWGDHVIIQDLISANNPGSRSATAALLQHVARDATARGRRCIYLERFKLKGSDEEKGIRT